MNFNSESTNYQAIYDKVEQASSLLRSRSAERNNNSVVKQYERSIKRNQFMNTQNVNELSLGRVICLFNFR